MEQVFLNGEIIEAQTAHIPVTDSSFLYGIGLFETMRAVGGRVFRLADHLARLNASAKALAIRNRYSETDITVAIDALLEANTLTTHAATVAVQRPDSIRRARLQIC